MHQYWFLNLQEDALMQCPTVAPDEALRVTYPVTDASSRLRNMLIDRSNSTDYPGTKLHSWVSELISLEGRTIGSALSWGTRFAELLIVQSFIIRIYAFLVVGISQ